MLPFLARFREIYEQSSLPLGRICLKLGLSPDMLTYASLGFSAIAGYALSQQLYAWGIAWILLMGFADMLDGATARAGGTANAYGTVLDHVSDRYAEFFVLGGIMLSGVVAAEWVLFTLFGMVMASYVRARAESTKLLSCNVGFAGRQEKLGLLILGMAGQMFLREVALIEWTVITIGVVSHITAVQRLAYTRRMIIGPGRRGLRKGSGAA